ncbi:MAG: MFS transporter [Eubacteriales bacterium]
MKPMIRGKKLAGVLTYVYFASYVTRVNLGAVLQAIITETGYEKSAFSAVLVCLSVSYGLGQIVNGYIGDRIKPQNLILTGLCTSTLANLLFPFFSASIPAMCALWTINGFAQAMMWPPMVRIMVVTMDEATYGASVVKVSLGSSFGTILVYLVAPIVIRFFTWKFVMLGASALGAVSAVIWFFLKDRCYSCERTAAGGAPQGGRRFRMPRRAVFPFVMIAAAVVFQGMIRDGVTSWMPTYLCENFGLQNDKSVFLTVSLAIFGMAAFVLSGLFYKKFFKNEVACAALIFAFAAVCSLMLMILFGTGNAIVSVIFMALITGSMHGVNLMLISHVPKRFRKYGNISTVSGLINSFVYVGAAVATYGIARLSEVCGWRATTAVWCAILTAGTLSCLAAIPKWKSFIDE